MPAPVLIVDDHELVGTSLLLNLRGEGLDAHLPSRGGADAILAAAARLTPGLVLLDLERDPKLAWALRNRALFPIDVNRAPRETLLRVPGLGARVVTECANRGLILRLRAAADGPPVSGDTLCFAPPLPR